jgi:hypothetical protein
VSTGDAWSEMIEVALSNEIGYRDESTGKLQNV